MYSKETGIFFALLISLAILLFLIFSFIISILRYQKRKVSYDRASIRKQLRFLEEEKERISFNLHDDLGALMASLKMRLQLITTDDVQTTVLLASIEDEIQVIMNRMRNISHDMMPSILNRKGLSEAIRDLINYMLTPAGIETNFHSDSFRTNTDIERQLYRITQELFSNIIKHSKATEVLVDIRKNGNFIQLRVKDNGVGFNSNQIGMEPRGAGLRNIMARMAIIKGKIYLTTKAGTGVNYLLKCPAYAEFENKSACS